MANQRDFLTPVAAYKDKDAPSRMYVKWGGTLWATEIAHSPLDVIASPILRRNKWVDWQAAIVPWDQIVAERSRTWNDLVAR